MQRNPLEIKNAVSKLERNLDTCVPYCCFGNDNKKKIISMIEVVKNDRSQVWINSTYLSPLELLHEYPDNSLWRSAMDARDWLDGDFAIDELLFKEMDSSKNFLLDGILFNR